MNSPLAIFNKIIALCEKNGILTLERNVNVVQNIKYGPLGHLLKHNIHSEWLKFFINHMDAEIFPTEIQSSDVYHNNSDELSYMPAIQEQFKIALPLMNRRLPFGLAISGCHMQNAEENCNLEDTKNESSDITWRLKSKPFRILAFFCDPKESMYWFHYWQRKRYIWWRKFSDVPSNFLLKSDKSSNSQNSNFVHIQYQYPWGLQNAETIRVFSESQMRKLPELSFALDSAKTTITPGLVLCESSLDEAVFMYICNSFEVKWLQRNQRTILRLHHKFCPYKVSIVINCTNDDHVKKLSDVLTRLVKKFKQNRISVFPSPPLNFASAIDSEFERFDEMGIPYVIILRENSLITGIAGLRNRDTTLEENVHITELTSKLTDYLLMKTSSDKNS